MVRDWPSSKARAACRSRDSTNKGEIECWHCSSLHYKNKCLELKLLDVGVQNLNINDCDKEHNLYSADDGYGLV
jgi:hypothetical protein